MTAQNQISAHQNSVAYNGVEHSVDLKPYIVKCPTPASMTDERSTEQVRPSTRPRIEYADNSPIPVYKPPHLWVLPDWVRQSS